MLRRIEIANFRRLSRVEIDVTPAVALVGPNSCGKTSVLHAVQLACAALSFGARRDKIGVGESGWLTLIQDEPLRDDESFLPGNRWNELFFDANLDRTIDIKLFLSEERPIEQAEVKLHAGRADALRIDVRIRTAEDGALRRQIDALPGRRAFGNKVRFIGAKKAEADIIETVRDHLPRAVFIPAFYGVVRDEEYRARGAVESLLRGGQQGQVVRNLLMRLKSLEGVNAFLATVGIDARLTRSSSEQEMDSVRFLEAMFRDRNGSLELSSAGTGLASLLALHAAIKFNEGARAREEGPVLFMLDEPEAHLHPRLQGDTGAALLELITQAGHQLLCATHSIEMINRFGRDARASIVRINAAATRTEDAVRVLRGEEERLDELSAWCDLSPFAQLNLLATRRVLFHEGETDFAILAACAALHLGRDPVRLQRFKAWTPVRLSGTGNAAARDVLKKALSPLLTASPEAEAFHVVRVLDRDYHRTPQWEHRQDPGSPYDELDVVWSRHSIESLFLGAECLSSWLDAALSVDGRPAGLDRARLAQLAQEAIEKANSDPELIEQAKNQRGLKVAASRKDEDLINAFKQARAEVTSAPEVYQQGHARCAAVLNHIRETLLADPATRPLARRVWHDVAQIVTKSPLRPDAGVLPPALIPDEIRKLLDYLAQQ